LIHVRRRSTGRGLSGDFCSIPSLRLIFVPGRLGDHSLPLMTGNSFGAAAHAGQRLSNGLGEWPQVALVQLLAVFSCWAQEIGLQRRSSADSASLGSHLQPLRSSSGPFLSKPDGRGLEGPPLALISICLCRHRGRRRRCFLTAASETAIQSWPRCVCVMVPWDLEETCRQGFRELLIGSVRS